MAMPKKGRRSIVVNDTLYYYKISGCIYFIIQNTETGKISKWGCEMKKKWGTKTSPGFVRHLIETDCNPTQSLDHFYHESRKSKDYGHEFTLKFSIENNYNHGDFKLKESGEKTNIARNVRWFIDCAESAIQKVFPENSPRRAEMERLCDNLRMQLAKDLTTEEMQDIHLFHKPLVLG